MIFCIGFVWFSGELCHTKIIVAFDQVVLAEALADEMPCAA